LETFTAGDLNGSVNLNWTTANEINNQGFEIERNSSEGNFSSIAFINGNGTTTETQNYSYTDQTVTAGKYLYRLKRSLDGPYSDIVGLSCCSGKICT
jgi:hypothetical protein